MDYSRDESMHTEKRLTGLQSVLQQPGRRETVVTRPQIFSRTLKPLALKLSTISEDQDAKTPLDIDKSITLSADMIHGIPSLVEDESTRIYGSPIAAFQIPSPPSQLPPVIYAPHKTPDELEAKDVESDVDTASTYSSPVSVSEEQPENSLSTTVGKWTWQMVQGISSGLLASTKDLNVNEGPKESVNAVSSLVSTLARSISQRSTRSPLLNGRNLNIPEKQPKIDTNTITSKQNRRRLLVASEILSTERSYVQSLNRIHENIYKPLLESLWKYPSSLLRDKSMFQAIFSNFQDLRNVNMELLKQLEDRLAGPQGNTSDALIPMLNTIPTVNEDCWDPTFDKIGDIFLGLSPFLKMYSIYVRNFNQAMKVLETELRTNPQLKRFIQTQLALPNMGSLTVQAYLMMPVQRIPRYRLLLVDLFQHTPCSHPDYDNIQKALTMIESIAQFVNEEIRQHEQFLELIDIQHRMIGYRDVDYNTNIVIPGRRLIKKGLLTKVCRRDNQPRMFFLFNDMLVYASLSSDSYGFGTLSALTSPISSMFSSTPQPSLTSPIFDDSNNDMYYFHRSIPLSSMRVVDLSENDKLDHTADLPKFLNSFLIISHEKSFQVIVDNPAEKLAWIQALRSTSCEASRLANEYRNSVLISTHSMNQSRRVEETKGPKKERHFPELRTISNVLMPASLTSITPMVNDYSAPVWIPDSAKDNCMICDSEFNFFRRRHHCRKCGKICCHYCSTRKFVVPSSSGDRTERACDPCYFEMFQQEIYWQQERESVPATRIMKEKGIAPQSRIATNESSKLSDVAGLAAKAAFSLGRKRSISDAVMNKLNLSLLPVVQTQKDESKAPSANRPNCYAAAVPWRPNSCIQVPKLIASPAGPVKHKRSKSFDRFDSKTPFTRNSLPANPIPPPCVNSSQLTRSKTVRKNSLTLQMLNANDTSGASRYSQSPLRNHMKSEELENEENTHSLWQNKEIASSGLVQDDYNEEIHCKSSFSGMYEENSISACQLCDQPFHSLLRWRHECQCCKRVVCSSCASRKKPKGYLQNEDNRSRSRSLSNAALNSESRSSETVGSNLYRICDLCFYGVDKHLIENASSWETLNASTKNDPPSRQRATTTSLLEIKAFEYSPAYRLSSTRTYMPKVGAPVRLHSIRR